MRRDPLACLQPAEQLLHALHLLPSLQQAALAISTPHAADADVVYSREINTDMLISKLAGLIGGLLLDAPAGREVVKDERSRRVAVEAQLAAACA